MAQNSLQIIDNMEIDHEGKCVTVSVNPKIYPMPIIYSAAFVFIDNAFVILSGDPEKEVLVKLRPRKGQNLEILGREFNNELINYGYYVVQSERTKFLRDVIIHRALETSQKSDSKCACNDEMKDISKPWEEQVGKIDDTGKEC